MTSTITERRLIADHAAGDECFRAGLVQDRRGTVEEAPHVASGTEACRV